MAAPRQEDSDSLASLEERISRAVELVGALRRENQELTQRLETAEVERDRVRQEANAAATQAEKLGQELEELRSERKQVRGRIEKLLGQMDLLTNS
jgi:FtsZ-binding cell division protein ZapB